MNYNINELDEILGDFANLTAYIDILLGYCNQNINYEPVGTIIIFLRDISEYGNRLYSKFDNAISKIQKNL